MPLSLVLPALPDPCSWTAERERLDSSVATMESKLTGCCVTRWRCLCPTCTPIITRWVGSSVWALLMGTQLSRWAVGHPLFGLRSPSALSRHCPVWLCF